MPQTSVIHWPAVKATEGSRLRTINICDSSRIEERAHLVSRGRRSLFASSLPINSMIRAVPSVILNGQNTYNRQNHSKRSIKDWKSSVVTYLMRVSDHQDDFGETIYSAELSIFPFVENARYTLLLGSSLEVTPGFTCV